MSFGRSAYLAKHGLYDEGGKPLRLFVLHAVGKLCGISFTVNSTRFGANDETREGLEAIVDYPNATLHDYCRRYGVRFHEQEPPYLTQSRIASHLLRIANNAGVPK